MRSWLSEVLQNGKACSSKNVLPLETIIGSSERGLKALSVRWFQVSVHKEQSFCETDLMLVTNLACVSSRGESFSQVLLTRVLVSVASEAALLRERLVALVALVDEAAVARLAVGRRRGPSDGHRRGRHRLLRLGRAVAGRRPVVRIHFLGRKKNKNVKVNHSQRWPSGSIKLIRAKTCKSGAGCFN